MARGKIYLRMDFYYILIAFIILLKLTTATLSQPVNSSDLGTLNSNYSGRSGLRNLAGTESTSKKDIHFYLYSDPLNPKDFDEIVLNNVSTLEKVDFRQGQVKFIGPPFSGYRIRTDLLKDAYLKAGITNVIIMDYTKLVRSPLPFPAAFIGYFGAMRNVQKIGDKGADFINFLVKNNKIKDGKDVHIIGESLGAHIGASIARVANKEYGLTIGRLTGLDPAGPFNKKLGKNKFNKKYASFVDAIHTDIDGFGTPESLGHVDFYVNGGFGKAQPDCRFVGPLLVTSCAHGLAGTLFTLSVTKQQEFYGCPCKPIPSENSPLVCGKNTKCDKPILMGENSPTGARGNLYVKMTEKVIDWTTYIQGLLAGTNT